MATKSDNAIEVKLGYISRDIAKLTQMVEELSDDVSKNYVTKSELADKLSPITKLVFGLVGIVLSAVVYKVLEGVV
jgi:hypothetical protein